MNLPSSLKTLTTKQYELTARQRIIVVTVIGVIAIMITVYVTTAEVAVDPIVPISNTQQPPSKPVITTGTQIIPANQAMQTMRDPFAKPPEVKEQQNDSDRGLPYKQNNIPSAVPSMIPNKIVPSIPNENLRLTGIVGNAVRRLAVIMSANKSQSYSLNDRIGSYKIEAIDADSVILTNATGKLVLRLESPGQKGE